MKYKRIGLLFLLLLAFSLYSAYADSLPCQYQQQESYQEFGSYLYYTDSDEYYGQGLNLSDFQGGYGNIAEGCKYSFVINNPYPETLELGIRYFVFMSANIMHPEEKQEHIENVSIERYSYKKIAGEWGGIGGCSILENEIFYQIFAPEELTLKKGYITKERTVCKLCNGQICINDGNSCLKDVECGSGHCVYGLCSDSPYCYNNDCNCNANEVQCNNRICIAKNSIPIGIAPTCNALECVTNYKDSNGLCAKTPETLQEEAAQAAYEKQQQEIAIQAAAQKVKDDVIIRAKKEKEREFRNLILTIIGVTFCIFILAFIAALIKFFKGRDAIGEEKGKALQEIERKARIAIENTRREQQRIIDEASKGREGLKSQLNRMNSELREKENTLSDLRNKIAELEKRKSASKDDLVKLRDDELALSEQIDKLRQRNKTKTEAKNSEIDEQTKTIDAANDKLKSATERYEKTIVDTYAKQGYKVHIRNGYVAFDNTGNYFHIWKYESHHNKKVKPGHEIHHKDFNKLNNDINNLLELTREEHDRIHNERAYNRYKN
jgi:hypothetical protein